MHYGFKSITPQSAKNPFEDFRRTKLEHAIVIDIQPDKILIALVREDSLIINQVYKITGYKSMKWEDILSIIEEKVNDLKKNRSPIGIGICAGGSVNIDNQTLNLNEKKDFCIAQAVSNRFDLPAYLLSNCKAGIIGEHLCGGAKNYHTSVYLNITEDGIGAGVMHDSHLIVGEIGNAGGAGHTVVDTTYNLPCPCGGRGHWKAYMTPSGIKKFYDEYVKERSSGIESTDIHLNNYTDILNGINNTQNELLSGFSEEFGRVISNGFLNIIAMYNPGLIILDGPIITSNFDIIHKLFVDYTESSLFKKGVPEYPEIRQSKNEGYAPIIGMGLYVLKLYRGPVGDLKDMKPSSSRWYFPADDLLLSNSYIQK